ncbi:hypothetical protein [Variovorax sp. PAMC 28711]|uniref:hypothetical protein n=1 Tax=Variovorax sp. PAMC 28711 TaxID=1795631 RepID=UPI00078CC00A|nr:hypothetical protein AX767_03755 [Variovorax sp. PAMC 28711]
MAIGKAAVSTQLIERVARQLGREVFEVPVGFKWFSQGLGDGSLGFAGEESAGAAFLRRDGSTWTTDKDGITAALLSAEITAQVEADPGARYLRLAKALGTPHADRVDAPATAPQKQRRPSDTEDIYKIYVESFRDEAHLKQILKEAQTTVDSALAPAQRAT